MFTFFLFVTLCCLSTGLPTRPTHTDHLVPYTPLFRSPVPGISGRASLPWKGVGRKWTWDVTDASVIADRARASSASRGVMRIWSVDRASRVSVMSRLLQNAHAVTGGVVV